jgi:hypothetical protein
MFGGIKMRYELNGHWYTPNELSEMSGIPAHTIRDRLRRGFPVEEAVKITPIHECVTAFNESSLWEDWIGMSINELHKIFWNWCISNGHTPISKQGFSRQLFSMYPNLTIVPTKVEDRYNRIIREKDRRD